MKKHNRIIVGIMAMCLAFGVTAIPESIAPAVSITASAEDYTYDDLTYKFSEDENGEKIIKVTKCNKSATEVTILNEIDGVKVTSISNFAFSNCRNLISINIPDSVKSIENSAFYGCRNLTSINIPDSVKSIGNSAFYDCRNLTSISIPDSVTSLGSYAFVFCDELTSVKISENMTSINSYTFLWCTGLTSIEIPDSVTSIEDSAFADCENLTSVIILNPECEIYDSSETISNYCVYNSDGIYEKSHFNGTIYGYDNSTAQEYAENHSYKFESIGEAPEKETATGDMNGDNKFNVSDIVLLQKYISGADNTEISDWQQADLYSDGILDIFDLCLMRKKLIEK